MPPHEAFIALFAAKIEDDLDGEVKEKARAIRFVRNRVNHQWADAIYLREDAGSRAT